jgi:hypothetical protein
LNGHRFDEETIRVLSVAFVIVRAAPKLQDRDEQPQHAIAAKLIELVKQGERDPKRLADRVLAKVDAGGLFFLAAIAAVELFLQHVVRPQRGRRRCLGGEGKSRRTSWSTPANKAFRRAKKGLRIRLVQAGSR